mmetsp:Transcript_24200/g.49163  ORF Transcript_24200/g.49163 Transcript_24200/m.49163 type:complete len:87 (-) Transcript_24200:624-884(-)
MQSGSREYARHRIHGATIANLRFGLHHEVLEPSRVNRAQYKLLGTFGVEAEEGSGSPAAQACIIHQSIQRGARYLNELLAAYAIRP